MQIEAVCSLLFSLRLLTLHHSTAKNLKVDSISKFQIRMFENEKNYIMRAECERSGKRSAASRKTEYARTEWKLAIAENE